jgi:hypothetical protein
VNSLRLGVRVVFDIVRTQAVSVVRFVFLNECSGNDSSTGRLLVVGFVVGTIRVRDFSNAICRSSSVMLIQLGLELVGQCSY